MYVLKNNWYVTAKKDGKNSYTIRNEKKILFKWVSKDVLNTLWFDKVSKANYKKAYGIVEGLKDHLTGVKPTKIIIDDAIEITKDETQKIKTRLYDGPGTFFGVDPAGEGKDVGAITMVKHHRDCGRCFREHYFGHFNPGIVLHHKGDKGDTGPIGEPGISKEELEFTIVRWVVFVLVCTFAYYSADILDFIR